MTKAKIASVTGKDDNSDAVSNPPTYSTIDLQAPVTTQLCEQVDQRLSSRWYVLSILATIFCCVPFGLIGLVHAMLSKHEAERGNIVSHKRRLRQARWWTSCAIAIGLIVTIIIISLYAVALYNKLNDDDTLCNDGTMTTPQESDAVHPSSQPFNDERSGRDDMDRGLDGRPHHRPRPPHHGYEDHEGRHHDGK